jgi:D-3-phosphoglycerate dehydrogenase
MTSVTRTPRVVHIDPVKPELPIEAALFEAAGIDFSARRCTTDDEVVEAAADADGILCLAYRLPAGVLERLPALRVIVRYGIGVDNVDVDAATRRGVAVCNVPDYCVDEVANHTMALLLAANRKLVQQNAAIRGGLPFRLRPMGPLNGETLGLVGFGRLARAVAARARAFGLRIVAYDPMLSGSMLSSAEDVELVDLDELLERADYVSVHVPLTPQTAGLIGARELALMKPTSYLISTARGGVIAEDALADALRDGRVAGAGLDVWEHEPVASDHPLLAFDSVLATGHTAFYSDRSVGVLRERVADVAIGVLTGADLSAVVNRDVLPEMSTS